MSVSKKYTRSVNATRPHSANGPTRSGCKHHTCTVTRSREASQAKHWPRVQKVAAVVLEHAQPRVCASIVWKQAFAKKDLPRVWRLHTCTLLHSCHGTSPLGVPETLCEAVRLARNLRHGIVLVVGDVVDQRFCLGSHPWSRVPVYRTMLMAISKLNHVCKQGLFLLRHKVRMSRPAASLCQARRKPCTKCIVLTGACCAPSRVPVQASN